MSEWNFRLPGGGPAEPCRTEPGRSLASLVLAVPFAGQRRLNRLSVLPAAYAAVDEPHLSPRRTNTSSRRGTIDFAE